MRQVRVLDVLIFVTLMTLSTPILVWAHGFAGKRFFPTTLTIDDPFVSDELSFQFDYIKELTFRTLCRSAEAFLGSTLKTGSGSQSMRRL